MQYQTDWRELTRSGRFSPQGEVTPAMTARSRDAMLFTGPTAGIKSRLFATLALFRKQLLTDFYFGI
jgi:hypothetical protein